VLNQQKCCDAADDQTQHGAPVRQQTDYAQHTFEIHRCGRVLASLERVDCAIPFRLRHLELTFEVGRNPLPGGPLRPGLAISEPRLEPAHGAGTHTREQDTGSTKLGRMPPRRPPRARHQVRTLYCLHRRRWHPA